MAVIAIAEMFGISGRRDELATLLERFGGWAGGEPGCRRYIFAASLADPSRFVLVSEWETEDALDAHYRSQAFADFQLGLDGLLDRPKRVDRLLGRGCRPAVEHTPDGPAGRRLGPESPGRTARCHCHVADATRADANDTAERLISASLGEQSVKTSKEGKVAVVTDAAAGIGQAVAVRLAEDGARVALLDVGDAEATVALVDAIGREPLPLRCDVTDAGSSIVPGCAPRAAAGSSTCPRPP